MALSQTKQKILDYLQKNPSSTVKELIDVFGISKQAMAKHLSELIENDYIFKIGKPPTVYYSLLDTTNSKTQPQYISDLPLQTIKVIEDQFYMIQPNGTSLSGLMAFEKWTASKGFELVSYADKYLSIVSKYHSYHDNNGLIDATDKMQSTFKEETFLDKLYYSEFSAYEIFGKTKLYSQLLYAKTSEDKNMIRDLVSFVKEQIWSFVITEKFDAVGFVSPTVKNRKVQFMDVFRDTLNLPLPILDIRKIPTPIIVPQKTLKSPSDRVENAKTTFVVKETRQFHKILLLDDFAGSGSTLNFVAQKYKKISPHCIIYGYAICGTPNGVVNNSQKFEVVNEA